MQEEDRKALRSNRQALSKDLEAKRVASLLYSRGTFSEDDKDKVNAKSTPLEQREEVLDILPRRGPDAFSEFCNVLNEVSPHLEALLRRTQTDGVQEGESRPLASLGELRVHLPNVPPTAPPSTGANQQPHDQQQGSQALPQRVNNFSSPRNGLDDEDSGAGADAQPNGTGPELQEASPEVFVSYKWYKRDTAAGAAVMEAIPLLVNKLEDKGYRCWRDINQMGGGDRMYKEIDAGIRGSKVVICCVTEAFCRSTMCQNEATLAKNLGKPIIPVLFESMEWPPKGQLSLIFGDLLYIEMFETLESAGNFPEDKLQELFQKVRQHVGH